MGPLRWHLSGAGRVGHSLIAEEKAVIGQYVHTCEVASRGRVLLERREGKVSLMQFMGYRQLDVSAKQYQKGAKDTFDRRRRLVEAKADGQGHCATGCQSATNGSRHRRRVSSKHRRYPCPNAWCQCQQILLDVQKVLTHYPAS